MNQEDKDLLLQDLCARLPYKVICKIHYKFNNETTFGEDVEAEADCSLVRIDTQTQTGYFDWIYDWFCIEGIKPYLRSMSSMTEEELNEFRAFHCIDGLHPMFYQQMCNLPNLINMFKWLNIHHFDYRGLIEKGLALEAPKGMYK